MSSDTLPSGFIDGLPRTPATHFKLCFYGAVLRVLASAVKRFGFWDALFTRLPFLGHYNNELARAGIAGLDAADALTMWSAALNRWEQSCSAHLPVRAVARACALDAEAVTLFMTIGLAEEDPRFGALFDALQGEIGCTRPAAGLLGTWWNDEGAARGQLRRLLELGLIQPLNGAAARADWTFQIPPAIWDAARGVTHREPLAGTSFLPADDLHPIADLILESRLAIVFERVVALAQSGDCPALILRGPRHNGRGTIAGALARALGRGLLTIDDAAKWDAERLRAVGTLATLVHAVPLLRLDPAPGETIEIASIAGCDGPVVATIGRHGGVSGGAFARAVTLTTTVPDPALRAAHWRAAATGRSIAGIDGIAERFRLTSGGIRKAADLAGAGASLAGRDTVNAGDVRDAIAVMNRQALDTLAVHVGAPTAWSHVAVALHTRRELEELERRCRQRERLGAAVGPAVQSQLTSGVKALLFGPSGTGKTMAARALASSLQMDLYRLNVAAILNKYIGETEKNLNAVFARAEELDVMLLLDEGESWLSSRPAAINSATDKYAAFETNFLLERLESFEGVLIITTNGADRIDSAFHRRMDVMIEFAPPDPVERLAIWEVHLPPRHAVGDGALAEVAARCEMTGGQIRNAVLHATSRALDRGNPIGEADVVAAVEREYRKSGAVCPLAGVADGW
jgi:hypothetical protein